MPCAPQGPSFGLAPEQRTVLFLQHQQRRSFSQRFLFAFEFALQLEISLLQIPHFLGALAPDPGSTDATKIRPARARDEARPGRARDTSRSTLRRPARGSPARPSAVL